MRVLLIIPTLDYATEYPSFMSPHKFPTGFAYIAAALTRAGHQVFGLNPNNDTRFASQREMLSARVHQALAEHAPDLIGLGGLCVDFVFLKDCMAIIRRAAPRVPIVLGGGIVTNDAEYILARLRPDFCVVGEGEETIVQLAAALEQGGRDLGGISNLGYWDRGAPRFTRRDFDFPDLDGRAFPDYEPFGMRDLLDYYSWAAVLQLRYIRSEPRPMVLINARGCPFNCTFCVHEKNPGYRAQSVERSMQEIAQLYERYRFNVLFVTDETFATSKRRVVEFCDGIERGRRAHGWDFNWLFTTHARAALDEETLLAAKKTGLHFFSYGLESASPTVLASMNKQIKPTQIRDAIQLANKTRIGFGANFIFGDPAEDEDTICESMDFFVAHCRDTYLHFGWVQPYPGSRLFDRCLERGIIRDKDAYYDGACRRPFNMTSLPDHVWFPWALAMMWRGLGHRWYQGTRATRVERETATNPIARHLDLAIHAVTATCPDCGNEAIFREMLDWDRPRRAADRLRDLRALGEKVRGWSRLGFTAELLRIHLLLATCGPILSRQNRAQRALAALKPKPAYPGRSFLAICRHCHTPMRIYEP